MLDKDARRADEGTQAFVDALREWLGLAPLYKGSDDARWGGK